MKLVVCVNGSRFSSEWLSAWTKTVSGLSAAGHDVMARIPPSSIESAADRATWLCGSDSAPYGYDPANPPDMVLLVSSEAIVDTDAVTRLVASPHPFTVALTSSRQGTVLDPIVGWDEQTLGKDQSTTRPLSKDDLKTDAEYIPVDGSDLCLAALTPQAVEAVIKNEGFQPRRIENDNGTFRIGYPLSFCRAAAAGDVTPMCDLRCRVARETSGITLPPSDEARQ